MNGPDRELRAAVEAVALGRASGSHLDPEEIAAYHAGELPPEEERRVQDHLVACRECADLLLDLEGLGDPSFGADADLPPNAAEAVWAGVREQIRRDEPAKVLPMTTRRVNPPRMWQALAATLLIATAGLSVYVVSLRRTVDELSRPQLNAPVLDLYPEGRVGRGAATGAPEVPPEARLFTVILSPADRGSWADYEAEISNAEGVVWRARGLRRNAFGSFSLTLSRRALSTGEHRIRLFGLAGEERELIGEYVLQIPPA
jgi:Putative zinc-finger